jgi:hypothetical protein
MMLTQATAVFGHEGLLTSSKPNSPQKLPPILGVRSASCLFRTSETKPEPTLRLR